MGRIEEILKRLRRNKGYLLTDGTGGATSKDEEKQTQDISNNVGREAFKKQIQIDKEKDVPVEEDLDAESTYYNAKFVANKNNWYVDRQIREDYYKAPIAKNYFGNLELYSNLDDKITVKCKYTDNNGQEQRVELGRTPKKYMHRTMRLIENIIALQNVIAIQEFDRTNDIKEEYEKLKADEFEFSVLGKLILPYSKKESLRLPIVEEKDLYKKAILAELETEEVVSEIPIMELQAKVEEEGINEVVQEYIKFCKLAIDIGALTDLDWKEIDERNRKFRRAGNRDYNCVGDVFYERKPSFRKESFDKIEMQYFDEESKKEVDLIAKKTLVDNHEIIHYVHYIEDAKESAVRLLAGKKVIEYAVLLKKCINTYKQNNPRETNDINILNDMLTFAQIGRLRQMGLAFYKMQNKDKQQEDDQLE